MSARVALATCAQYPSLADDDPMLLAQLRARRVDAEPAVWDDPAIDWGRYELVILRSTWDYSWRHEQFLAWADSVPRLLNSAEVIRWNIDKRYLEELPESVPTQFVQLGEEWHPPAAEYVVKPAISSGSRHTGRYGPDDESRARTHVEELVAGGRMAMVQPYLDAVDDYGESALLFFAGEYSHTIRKGQILQPGQAPSTDMFVREQIRARTPQAAELALAGRVMDSLPWPRRELLYARVDLIPGPDGEPQLVELELTEPSLFFAYAEGAAERLADRVIERL